MFKNRLPDLSPETQFIVISGEGASPGGEVDYWHEACRRYAWPLLIKPSDERRLQVDLAIQKFGGLSVGSVQFTPNATDRKQAEVRQGGEDKLLFLFPQIGTVEGVQYGRDTLLKPGSGACYDGARPCTLNYPKGGQLLALEVPRAQIEGSVSGYTHLTNRDLSQASEIFPLVAGYVRQLATRTSSLDLHSAERVSRNLADLTCTMMVEMARRSPFQLSEYKTAALMRVLLFVDEHLANPELKPAMAAQALHLSNRYINQLLQAEGTSLERLIRHRRLERVATDLCDPALARRSISMIALARGFSDLSHFSTAFRRRFGVSPREHRHRCGPH